MVNLKIRGSNGVKISLDIKKSCVEQSKNNKSNRDIYNNYFHPLHPSMSYETFRHKILYWKNKQFADEWHDKSSFIGAHKRFMLFEWTPNRLSKIHYIGGGAVC